MLSLLSEVLDAGDVPFLAAGGIADARCVAAAIVSEASGVRVGNRFIAKEESAAHADYKAALIAAGAGEEPHLLPSTGLRDVDSDELGLRRGRTSMSSPPVPSPHASSEAAEIETVVCDYIQGWYAGNVERMDRALHPELVKRIPQSEDPDALREVTKARMLELTADGGGHAADPDMEIEIDDVSTDIAAARVLSPEYLDYLHLVKTSDGWKIANVLFHNRG